MKISIIVPVYNCKQYVSTCLDSILNQTYKNIEVLVIDDGSNDGTSKICDTYKKLDDRIVVIHKKNGGVSSARNVGISMCTGDYVLFVDSDDWLEEKACEQIIKQIDGKSQIYFFSCNRVLANTVEQQMDVIPEESIEGLIADIIACPKYQFYYIRAPWGKVFKRSILRDIRFPENLYIGEDACFILELLCKNDEIEKIKFCKGNWYNYRILETSAVRKYKNDLYSQSIEQYSYIKNLIRNKGIENNRMVRTAFVMLAWELLVGLKQNERMMLSGRNKLDSQKWIDRESEVLGTKDIDCSRFSKSQFVFWIIYRLFGRGATEVLLWIKILFLY